MIRRRHLASLATLLATPASVRAQSAHWPSRPVRLLVPFPPGTSADVVGRRLAEHLAAVLGQPVVVENRVGAGGVVGADALARAAPEGYVLGISSGAPHAIAPAVQRSVPYDPMRDFTHLAMLARFPLALAIGASSPVRSLQEFIAMARAKPGGGTIGTPGVGTAAHVAMELLRLRHGLELTHVPFRSGSEAAVEAMAGRLDGVLSTFGELATNDRLRLLGISASERLPGWPAVPTFREAGVDAVIAVRFGLCGPSGLPDAVAERLQREAEASSASTATAAALSRIGAAPHAAMSRTEMTAFVAEEGARWGEVVRAARIAAQ
jgi:tripartite-type tricarboxylate transporter receptor subunit TctC